ncbi:MAG: hypothetical protein QNJ51_30710 [Calothrix sp. MO_167.B12]|nr:hypothetical protein [Calothrix sp. MO_167.B12]
MPKLIFSKITVGMLAILTLASCSNATTDQYEATARTSYTWQVKYANDLTDEPFPRLETFGSNSLLNRNGLKPSGRIIGPDEKGLWWPTLPPRPSVDEIEQRKQRSTEQFSQPELLKSVEYKITYSSGEQRRTLPTNYQVYRQVVKAYPSRTPLELTLGVNDDSVEKAEPAGN